MNWNCVYGYYNLLNSKPIINTSNVQKIIPVVFLCISFQFSVAQDNKLDISGTVTDSMSHFVAGATVSIIYINTGSGVMFTTTDKNGDYHFYRSQNNLMIKDLSVKVNSIGYHQSIKKITSLSEKINFILSQDVKVLPNVKIKDRNDLLFRKGDTLNYNADKFLAKDDRYLGDIIKRLPGIIVTDDGTIKYNGVPINNFYIEGDNLLDDKYNIATDNIPSSDIEMVQIIEHNQNIKMLNGIAPSDRAALNIKLKDKSKLELIDNVNLEGGVPSKYNATVHNMAFKPRFKAINEIKSNNIGNDFLDEVTSHNLNDLLQSMENDQPQNIVNITLSTPDNLRKNRYFFNNALMGNINDLYKLSNGTGLRINSYYVHDIQTLKNRDSTTYYLPGNGPISYIEKANSRLIVNALHSELTLNVNNNKKYLNNTFEIEQSAYRNTVNALTNDQPLEQSLKSAVSSFSNRLNGVVLTTGKNIINYASYISYFNSPQSYIITPGWQQNILNDSIPYQKTFQQVQIPSFFTNNHFSFSYVKNNWKIEEDAGIIYQWQKLESGISLRENDNSIRKPLGFSNLLEWNKWKGYAKTNIEWKKNKMLVEITLPLNFTQIHYNDTVNWKQNNLSRFFFTPRISWRYRAGKENTLYAAFNYTNSLASINQLYGGEIMTDYRSFRSFDIPLFLGNSKNVSAGFSYKKTLQLFFGNFSASYTTQDNFYLYTSVIENNLSKLSTLPINNHTHNFSFSGNISKYIFALKTTLALNAAAQYGETQQMQNNILFSVNNSSINYGLKITPTITDWLQVDISTRYNMFTSMSHASGYNNQTASQWQEKTSINFSPVNKLSVQLSNEYYQSYREAKALASCFFLDSYVQYRFSKPKIDFRISCSNITNASNYLLVTISNNIISSSTYFLQPRMILLSAAFNF